jgi:hypothetical protein
VQAGVIKRPYSGHRKLEVAAAGLTLSRVSRNYRPKVSVP